ncbi:MAG: nitrilase-related carbon-nitrogen hydrolase [Candidatus Zixiibacteriota bacterium]
MSQQNVTKTKKIVRAGIVQFRPKFKDVDANLVIIQKLLGRKKFDLAVLPELATTGYNFKDRADALEVAEGKSGKSFRFFKELSAKTGGAIVWGLAEKAGDKLFNSAVLTTPEGKQYIYRKTHLFFREKFVFDPGDTGFKVFRWNDLRIGLMICFDWIFPEAARTLALKKAQIICHPSNLVMHYCQDAMVTRSIENGVYCITANRTGRENNGIVDLTFTGQSQITGVKGEKLLAFSKAEQGFKLVKFDAGLSDIKNINSYNNVIADRRRDYYRI